MLFTAVWEREGKMAGTPKEEIKRIADQFAFTGELISCAPCGSGHINETYMLRYRIGEMGSIKVILQKINREIFQKPEELMETLNRIHESARGMKTLEEWMAYMDEYTRKLEEQAKKQDVKREGVVISTLHAVKGLEYDNVYIMNVNEGSMPYRKAVLEAHLEEERRLFYVGMTRAKKKLCLYYVRQQYEKEREPSRFLEEAGL